MRTEVQVNLSMTMTHQSVIKVQTPFVGNLKYNCITAPWKAAYQPVKSSCVLAVGVCSMVIL